MQRHIRDFNEAVLALGGVAAASRSMSVRQSQISQWRVRHGRFPADYFLVVKRALERRGYHASHELFTFIDPHRKKNHTSPQAA